MDDPTKITSENLEQAPLLRGSTELFDINILPGRYRRRKISLISVLPWLIMIILMASLYPAAMNALDAQNLFLQERTDLFVTQAELEILQTNNQSLEEIQSNIESEKEKRNQIFESYGGIDLQGTSWNVTLLEIHQITPPDIVWNSISQQENEIQLVGIAANYQMVIDFSDSLNNLTGLQRAEITSLEQIIEENSAALPISPEVEGEPSTADPTTPYSFTILSITDGEVLP